MASQAKGSHEIGAEIVDRCVSTVVDLCSIPSPSGHTRNAVDFVVERLRGAGYTPVQSRKRSVLADMGGKGNPLILAAHVDTLGAMVRSIKKSGRLRITRIGNYPLVYIVGETCTVHTFDGGEYTATIQPVNPAAHVNANLRAWKVENDEEVEVVVDEIVRTRDEAIALNICAGNFISLTPRTVVTGSGFIKSRHLDDKASAGVLLSLAELARSRNIHLGRKVYLLFTTYEEVGHGGSAGIPSDAVEIISVDMGAVGDDLTADECVVSICAKDSGGPYDSDVVSRLIRTAKSNGIAHAVDIYPFYGSDAEATLRAGHDLAHGLLGPGVSASHGYERTHRLGLENTLRLLLSYISEPFSGNFTQSSSSGSI